MMAGTYLAKYSESAVLHVEGWRVRVARVGPRRMACGCQRHIPHSNGVQGAQHSQRATQRVAALDAGQRA